jgi:hypothetical protein
MATLRRAWIVGTGLLAKGQCRAAWRSCDGASPHVCSAVPLPGRALTVMGGLAAVIGGPVRGQPAARLLHRALHSASSKHRSATGLVSAWQHAGSAARRRGDLHLRQMSSSSGRNTAATSAATAGASSDGPTDGRTRSQLRASGGSSAVGGSQGLDFDMKRGDRESMASKVRSSCDHDVGSALRPWPPPPMYAARSVFGNRHTRAHYSLDLYDHVEIFQFFLACACDSLVLLFCPFFLFAFARKAAVSPSDGDEGARGDDDTKIRRLPSKTELSKLFALAHGESRHIALAVGLLFLSSGVTLSVPMGMGKIIDIIIGNAGGDPTVLTDTLV